MWVKFNNKTLFLDLDEYFLNLGNIEKESLKRIVSSSKTNEVLILRPEKSMCEDLQDAFRILDYQAKGTIGSRDVKVTLRALGMEPLPSKVQKLMELSSAEKKCSDLSREEFQSMLCEVLNDIDSDEQVARAYRMFDSRGQGGVTLQDLKAVAEKLNLDVADEELQMAIAKIELRVLIRYCWKRGLSTRKAAEDICAAEGEGVILKWQQRFDSGDMNLEDKPRSGPPLKFDDGDLQTELDNEPSSSTRELADELGVGKSTIHRHLKQLDFVHKMPNQDPHELTEAQANR